MAKYSNKTKVETGRTITTPSWFGSHASMVVEDVDATQVTLAKGEVLCKDDAHYYVTYKDRLDSGLADPQRQGKGVSYEGC